MREITNREKELMKRLLSQEKELIEELKAAYTTALNDIKGRIKLLQTDEMTQSKIYQLNYQKALEKQLSGAVDVLNGDNVQIISEYLVKAYEDGYLGSMYIMQGQDIPLLFGIDEKKLMSSVNKKIEDMTFANRINTNMSDFKKTVKAEISRGIANSSTYGQIAKQIQLKINENFNRSYRIAQTELGRVSSEAKYDNMVSAVNNGARVIKQWLATLDEKTRPDHAALDGQTREIDEDFTIGKYSAPHPHAFNAPEMDINCRCILLEQPTWDDLNSPRARRDNISGNIIYAKDYEDWKNKYYSDEALEYIRYTDKMNKKYKSGFKETLEKMTDQEYHQLLKLETKIPNGGWEIQNEVKL